MHSRPLDGFLHFYIEYTLTVTTVSPKVSNWNITGKEYFCIKNLLLSSTVLKSMGTSTMNKKEISDSNIKGGASKDFSDSCIVQEDSLTENQENLKNTCN